MNRIFEILSAPGGRRGVEYAAPTQIVPGTEAPNDTDDDKNPPKVSVTDVDAYTVVAAKPRMLDRWLDRVVEASGSEYVYFAIFLALMTWVFLGIPFGSSDTWTIIISDAQAIINMVFDAFLMRQQLNAHDSLTVVAACLRSRSSSHKRMLNQLVASGAYAKVTPAQFQALEQEDFAVELPKEDFLSRISSGVAAFLGHIVTIVAFWIGIFIWLGFGPYMHWSDVWQLRINSATSALMVFMLASLANVRERHTKYMLQCLNAIWKVDAALELKLRTATGDTTKNRTVSIPALRQSRIQRAIDYYADLVGTLIGIAILFLVIAIWIVVGPALHFDSNWWLLIGTYAGLIGLNDGFVLRNVSTVLGAYQDEQFVQVDYDDLDTLAVIGGGKLEAEHVADNSLICRISVQVGNICSHELTVVLGALTIVGLITGATVMQWSVTGQLLCNIPPSIIESFFTLILITGHNLGEAKRRVDIFNIYLRRLKLVSYVDTYAPPENAEPETAAPETTEQDIELEDFRSRHSMASSCSDRGPIHDGNANGSIRIHSL